VEPPVAIKPAPVTVSKAPPASQEQPATGMVADASRDASRRLDATLAEVHGAIQRQDDATVENLLTTAAAKAGSRDIGPEAARRIDGWRQLANSYRSFLSRREQALAAVEAGAELRVGNQKVTIVEVGDAGFTYQVAGQTKTTDRDRIPAGIMLAIVTAWCEAHPADVSTPDLSIALGAYHLAKPEPDAKRAREHWERVQAAGGDASLLLPLLDDPVLTRAAAEE